MRGMTTKEKQVNMRVSGRVVSFLVVAEGKTKRYGATVRLVKTNDITGNYPYAIYEMAYSPWTHKATGVWRYCTSGKYEQMKRIFDNIIRTKGIRRERVL